MLVISRRAGERIVIGNDVHIIVTDIRRRTVRIGVQGRPETTILRGEIYDAIEQANKAALAMGADEEAALEAAMGNRVMPVKAQRPAAPVMAASASGAKGTNR